MSLKLVPISPFVSVTETGTSAALTLQSALIQKIVADGSGSVLTVLGKNGSNGIEKYSVTQTPAQVAALTQVHIELTEYSTTTWSSMYVNVMCFRDQILDESTHRVVFLDFGGGARSFRVTETLVNLKTALNTAIQVTPATSVETITAGNTVASTENYLIVRITGAAGTITLQPALAGKIVYMVNTTNNAFTIEGNGAETIDTAANIQLGKGANMTFVCHEDGKWTSIVTQVGNSKTLYVQDVSGINGSDIDIYTADNPVGLRTTGTGNVVLDAQGTGKIDIKNTGVGAIEITGDGANRILIDNSTAAVEIDGTQLTVPDAIRPQLDDVTTGIEFSGSPAAGTSIDLVVDNGAATPTYQLGTSFTQALGLGSTYIDSLFVIGSHDNVTGAVAPGTPVTKAFVNVTTNALNAGVQIHTGLGFYYVIRNAGANPCFVWDQAGVLVRATAIAVGDVARFYKIGTVWVSEDFTPVA